MSKGGSSSQTTEIPAWLENAAIQNINRANDVSQIGYTPYYGPDVAAFSPMQQQSMQSTGNAASAFGLAPQGFDAMAGMPQAQTFANGMQGYSSAPLYQESVDQFQANRPAQFQAMADMFIDPITGAPAKNNYQASPEQVQQMFSNSGGGGGIPPTGGGGNRSGNNDGEYFGVNSQYNPYGYNTPTENISGEKDRVADYRDMSFGEGGRRDIGFGENAGNFLKNLTGISTIERGIDYGQGLADGFTPSPSNGLLSQTSGPSMTQAEAVNQMNEAARNYMPTLPQTTVNERESTYSNRQSLLDNLSFGGSNNSPFSSANTPAAQVDLLAATVAARNAATEEAEIEAQEKITLERIANETEVSNANMLANQYALYGAGQNFTPPSFDNVEAAKLSIMDLISSDGFDAKYDTDGNGQIDISDMLNAVKLGVNRNKETSATTGGKSSGTKEKATTGGKSSGTVGDKAGNVIKDSSGNAVKFGKKKKAKPKKIVSNSGREDRETDTWSPPKSNGYAGQSGKKSTKGKAKTGYSFGL